jgi:hypothetical protein
MASKKDDGFGTVLMLIAAAAVGYGAAKGQQRTGNRPPSSLAELFARLRERVSTFHAAPDIRRLAYELHKQAGGEPVNRILAIDAVVRKLVEYHPDPGGRHDYYASLRETLQSRVGDCDDQAIAVATLLEADGFETAFLAMPQHVVACVAVGGEARHDLQRRLGGSTRLLADPNNPTRWWLPLEVTGKDLTPGHLGRHTQQCLESGHAFLEIRPTFHGATRATGARGHSGAQTHR